MKILFLDDMPQRVPLLNKDQEIVYVRDFEEFKLYLSNNDLPDVISFDHDLAEVHYGADDYADINRPASGTDCARWAVEKGFIPKKVIIHSWNPDGARRIAMQFVPTDAVIITRPFNSKTYLLNF